MPDHVVFCFTGIDSLQITVSPTPESFPHGKVLPVSTTWPFSEVQSSSAVARIQNVLGPSPDNTSTLQFPRTSLPKAHRRARAHGDFSSSPYQGSGHSASLEPSKDSTESVVQQRPQGGKDAASVSGLPHTSMLPSFSMIPSQPAWVGTPSISTQHSPRPDMLPFLPPPSSSSLAPDSPHSIIFSKPVEQPTQVAFFPQRAPPGSSSSQSIANSPNPFADDMNHTPSKNAQDLIGIPHLGFSGSSTMQQPKLPPTAGPYSAGPPTPEFLSSMAELTHLPPLPLVPGSLPWLPDGPPSWSVSEVASSPTSTQPVEAGVAEGVHSGSSLPTSKSAAVATVTQEAVSSLFQTAKSVAEEMTSRKLAAATANDLAHPMHSSAAPENSQGPVLSAKHTASSLVPFPLPLPTASRGQTILSRAWKSTAADLPSVPTFPQLAQNHGSPSTGPQMSSPQEGGTNGSPPAAATDLPLSSKSPDLLSTTWAFPLQEEDSVTAVLKKNEKANLTVAPQTLPSKETPSLHTVNGFTSDSSTDHTSSFFITTLRTNLPLESAHPSLSSVRSTQTLSPPPSLSNIKPEAHTAVVDHSELPTSQQVMAFPSAAEVYDFSTTRHVKKPATTDVFWSSLSMETGSLSIEPMISGLLQQTNYDLNGHAINSTSWETHSASAPPPSGSTSAANTIKSSDFRATAGLFVTTEGFSIQLPVLRTSTNQPIQQSEVTMVGSHTDVVSITSNYSRDFQTAEVEENPTASQRAASHPRLQLPVPPTRALLPASPSLTSTASLHQVLADGMDTSLSISRDVSPSPVLGASPPFQSLLRYHSTDESPLSPRAILRTPSKVLLASQRPDKWSGAATHAGSLFPGTPKTGMTASVDRGSSSSTQTPGFA